METSSIPSPESFLGRCRPSAFLLVQTASAMGHRSCKTRAGHQRHRLIFLLLLLLAGFWSWFWAGKSAQAMRSASLIAKSRFSLSFGVQLDAIRSPPLSPDKTKLGPAERSPSRICWRLMELESSASIRRPWSKIRRSLFQGVLEDIVSVEDRGSLYNTWTPSNICVHPPAIENALMRKKHQTSCSCTFFFSSGLCRSWNQGAPFETAIVLGIIVFSDITLIEKRNIYKVKKLEGHY